MNHVTIGRLGVVLMALVPGRGNAQQTGASPHGALSSGVDCAACHSESSWKPAKTRMDFDHDRQTGFPLTGRHVEARCTSCHLGLRFAEPSLATGDCANCHVDVHRGNLSAHCIGCHTTESFTDVQGVTVHAKTSFPLTGAHLQVSCESCHRDDRGGAFTTLDTDCLACHEPEYVAAQPVDHVAAGFPTNCEQCHSTLAFTHSVAFDHVTVSSGFQLIGAHAQIRCTSCHGADLGLLVAATSQNDCIGCHQSEYDREHGATGFPTDCLTCHTIDSWQGAVFATHDADFFPIFSGKHNGKWDTCETCHNVAGNFQLFTCFNCHEHRQTAMDDKHRGVGGYTYDSSACYSCHPAGRKEGG